MRKVLLLLSGLLAGVLLGGAEQELSQAEATGVLGRMVKDSSGQQVGRVVDVIVDPTGKPRAIVVDTGGFMGVGARRVAVAWDVTHVPPPGSKDGVVTIDLSDDQVKSAPEYTDRSKPVTIVGAPAAAVTGSGAAAPDAPGPPPSPAPAPAPNP
jgi:sporulation protein YlmC with PRC-barrel domain